MRPTKIYALSLKQPWAALLVHGRKSIEVRRWPTTRRGRILIHAARISDERPEAWKYVTEDIRQTAEMVGGIIGQADLTGCLIYRSRERFSKDQVQHLNEPEWYDGSIMYGFTFANAAVLPFRKYPGWMRFFPIEESWQGRKKASTH